MKLQAPGAYPAPSYPNTPNALTIVATFDSSITNDPKAAEIEAGINAAIAQLQRYILNPTTVNITFQEGEGLGTSTTFGGNLGYSTYRTSLMTGQVLSANDNTAIATLPATGTNPVNGDANIRLTTPLFRTLGFNVVPPAGSPDSTIILNTAITNNIRTGPQDLNKYDLQQVTLHEMLEVLGAGGGGSALPTLNSNIGTIDLFRYGSNGVRSFTISTTATAYFSINAGATNLGLFNQTGGGDYGDWDGDLNGFPQVQDAASTPAVQLNLDTNELTELDVVGYNLNPAPGFSLLSAISRQTHGAAGVFDINLPLSGAPGVECRSTGGNYTFIFTFDNNVVSGTVNLTTGTGTVAATPTMSGGNITVNLTGVTDVQKITLTLNNVTDIFGQVLPSTPVSVNMLIGDVNGSKLVNSSDIASVKSSSGSPVTAANFRADVAVNGTINASDTALVKSRSGASLP